MYSESDLSAAVTAGVLSEESVTAFRTFTAERRASPAVDEEHFRLLSGFNDIFVSIAIVLILVAVGVLGSQLFKPVMGAFSVAVASWGLAEFFTRKRRMALPSILLLVTFLGSLVVGATSAFDESIFYRVENAFNPFLKNERSIEPDVFASLSHLGLVLILLSTSTIMHWWRFRVPITVAAGMAMLIGIVLALLSMIFPGSFAEWITPLIFLIGLVTFAYALHWDASDRRRVTRQSDVAFWLHLLAAPLIVHPAFAALGLLGAANSGIGTAIIGISLYLLLGVVALLVDRRALLVSALAYVMVAISILMKETASVSQAMALTALVVGSGLAMLSAFWHRTRAALMTWVPEALRSRLPVV